MTVTRLFSAPNAQRLLYCASQRCCSKLAAISSSFSWARDAAQRAHFSSTQAQQEQLRKAKPKPKTKAKITKPSTLPRKVQAVQQDGNNQRLQTTAAAATTTDGEDDVPTPLLADNQYRIARLRAHFVKNKDDFMIDSQQVFRKGECKFVTSCTSIQGIERSVDLRHRKQQRQHSVAEICFIGRSNVGKSSLINAILGEDDLVKTSKTPGRTQTLNYFYLQDAFYLVDVPGYGYAKAPVEVVKDWRKLMEQYLIDRSHTPLYSKIDPAGAVANSPPLQMAMLLMDARRTELQQSDTIFVELLERNNVPYSIVMTKCDKVSKREARVHAEKILETIQKIQQKVSEGETIKPKKLPLLVQTSSKEKQNIDLLRAMLVISASRMNVVSESSSLEKKQEKREVKEQQSRVAQEESDTAGDAQGEEAAVVEEKPKALPRKSEWKRSTAPVVTAQSLPYVYRSHLVDDRVARDRKQKRTLQRIVASRAHPRLDRKKK